MNNVIKYSDIYQRIVRKLQNGGHLTKIEKERHNQLCRWFAMDFDNETYICNEENCGN